MSESSETKGGSASFDPPARVKSVSRNEQGQLVVRLEGQDEPIVDVRVARCFPWSTPDTYISIRKKEGKEIALFKTLDEMDEGSRKTVAEELQDKNFNPKIRRVIDYKSEFGILSITAQTDRGLVTFQIRSRDDVRLLSPTSAIFRDADGNTYELSDLHALDPRSRKYLQEHF